MLDKLKVVHWNVQTLTRKRRLVIHCLRDHKIDVMLISDTRLREGERYTIPYYHVYRQDDRGERGSAIRGLAVLVRRSIVHQLLP